MEEPITISSIKVEVNRKKGPLRLEFLLLRSPTDQVRSVPIFRARCSVVGRVRPAIGDFSTSDFHRLSATKPVCSETSKAERRSL
jgi:hypothetical protein